jgi:predicted TIM-barrel fold metal-dependent hydrolase
MAIDIRVSYSQYDALGRPFGVKGVLDAMNRYGIESSVLVPSLAMTSDFQLGNKELFEVVGSNDRLYGYFVPNPNYTEESIQLMRTMMNSSKMVGAALFQGSSAPYPNVDDYRDILNAYRRFSKPVLVNTPNAESIAAAEKMAKEFPNVKFIFGSMGGEDWRRALMGSAQLNVVYETSGSFDAEKIEMAVTSAGAHRVLFGSDLPFSDPASMLALIRSSSIPREAMQKIVDLNARKLLNIESPSAEASAPAGPPQMA